MKTGKQPSDRQEPLDASGIIKVPLGTVNLNTGECMRGSRVVHVLNTQEKRALRILCGASGEPVQRTYLAQQLNVVEGTFNTLISNLRKHIGDTERSVIASVRGGAYAYNVLSLDPAYRDCTARLADARRSRTLIVYRHILREVIEQSQTPTIVSEAYADLAAVEDRPHHRRKLRLHAIRCVRPAANGDPAVDELLAFGRRIIDYLNDGLARDLDLSTILPDLRFADKMLKQVSRTTANDILRSHLLAVRSTVVLHRVALAQRIGQDRQKGRVDVQKIAMIAVKTHTNPRTLIAYSQALLHDAQQGADRKARAGLLTDAERVLAEGDVGVVGLHVRARTYRRVWRPFAAVSVYERYIAQEDRVQNLWAGSVTYGDAASNILVEYRGHPKAQAIAERAIVLLKAAVHAGHVTMHHLGVLAFLQGLCGDQLRADELLAQIRRKAHTGDWSYLAQQVHDILKNPGPNALQEMFALGVCDPAAWTRLGDYAGYVKNDWQLAYSCHLNSHLLERTNVIALANLAKACLKLAETRHDRALELVDEAGGYLNAIPGHRALLFQWWRRTCLSYVDACETYGLKAKVQPGFGHLTGGQLGFLLTEPGLWELVVPRDHSNDWRAMTAFGEVVVRPSEYGVSINSTGPVPWSTIDGNRLAGVPFVNQVDMHLANLDPVSSLESDL